MPPPLAPGVKRSSWRVHDPDWEVADEGFARVRRQVLERHRYTCQYCGFTTMPDRRAAPTTYLASGYLEVHHLDDDHGNNHPSNLLTVCPFCHLVFHAGNAGHRNTATVIWAPWIAQADLNLLVNAIMVAMAREGEHAPAAMQMYARLTACADRIVSEFGESMADAANFGSVLMMLANRSTSKTDLYARRTRLFAGVRLLPNPDAFGKAVEWWSEHGWPSEAQWSEIAAQ